MVLKLKAVRTRLNFCFLRGRLCIRLEKHPTINASIMLISTTETRMNGRFTDMLPVSPGNFTFNLAARHAINRNETKRTAKVNACALTTAFPSSQRPKTMISAMKACALTGEVVMSVFAVFSCAEDADEIIDGIDGIIADDPILPNN